ncbi:MAG: EF-P beta-lysylation protein EpmB, partial [Proteobacteria bacterium]|nr:EF-P beta-lysylation protein EpmB [Pseudomonadota bacterium]
LADAITNPQELCSVLSLDFKKYQKLLGPKVDFPLRVPRRFVERMEKNNWRDPLLLQVLPLAQETEKLAYFSTDPLEESKVNPLPGLLHKYYGRVLLIAASGCAINCRYCFRRHFPYSENTPGSSGWGLALNYISQDASISEVILSGGDPLILKDPLVANLVDQLEKIDHVKTLRIHTRLPVVLPERITESLIRILKNSRFKVVVVIHCNHPREISSAMAEALVKLGQAGILLFNQFVLLKRINDNAETLIELSEQLFLTGVLPYYMHLLDPVEGAAHFSVSAAKGKKLLKDLSARLPGYLVPRFVVEKAGEKNKILL